MSATISRISAPGGCDVVPIGMLGNASGATLFHAQARVRWTGGQFRQNACAKQEYPRDAAIIRHNTRNKKRAYPIVPQHQEEANGMNA